MAKSHQNLGTTLQENEDKLDTLLRERTDEEGKLSGADKKSILSQIVIVGAKYQLYFQEILRALSITHGCVGTLLKEDAQLETSLLAQQTLTVQEIDDAYTTLNAKLETLTEYQETLSARTDECLQKVENLKQKYKDISTGRKAFLPDYKKISEALESAIRKTSKQMECVKAFLYGEVSRRPLEEFIQNLESLQEDCPLPEFSKSDYLGIEPRKKLGAKDLKNLEQYIENRNTFIQQAGKSIEALGTLHTDMLLPSTAALRASKMLEKMKMKDNSGRVDFQRIAEDINRIQAELKNQKKQASTELTTLTEIKETIESAAALLEEIEAVKKIWEEEEPKKPVDAKKERAELSKRKYEYNVAYYTSEIEKREAFLTESKDYFDNKLAPSETRLNTVQEEWGKIKQSIKENDIVVGDGEQLATKYIKTIDKEKKQVSVYISKVEAELEGHRKARLQNELRLQEKTLIKRLRDEDEYIHKCYGHVLKEKNPQLFCEYMQPRLDALKDLNAQASTLRKELVNAQKEPKVKPNKKLQNKLDEDLRKAQEYSPKQDSAFLSSVRHSETSSLLPPTTPGPGQSKNVQGGSDSESQHWSDENNEEPESPSISSIPDPQPEPYTYGFEVDAQGCIISDLTKFITHFEPKHAETQKPLTTEDLRGASVFIRADGEDYTHLTPDTKITEAPVSMWLVRDDEWLSCEMLNIVPELRSLDPSTHLGSSNASLRRLKETSIC